MKIAVVCCEQEHLDTNSIDNLVGGAKCIDESAQISLWCLFGDISICENNSPFYNIYQTDMSAPLTMPEQRLQILSYLYHLEKPDCIIFADDNKGNELAGRLARRVGADVSLHVVDLIRQPGGLQIFEFAYNGNLAVSVEHTDGPLILSVSKGCFHSVCYESAHIAKRASIRTSVDPVEGIRVIERETYQNRNDLSTAKRVVICGQGVGSKENVEKVKSFAGAFGFQVAGSRPTVIEGWITPDALIGISGKVITPDICILLGVSGAAAFYAGVRKSKMLVAVNIDKEAMIFQKCDYVIKEDCMKLVEEMIIEERGSNDKC